MSQRIYFSGVGEPDLWNSRFLTGVSKQMLSFLTWDATPDLAQATWEWPNETPWIAVTAFSAVVDHEARLWDQDWELRGKKEFARQLYR
jgi:hypothetical protein